MALAHRVVATAKPCTWRQQDKIVQGEKAESSLIKHDRSGTFMARPHDDSSLRPGTRHYHAGVGS